MTASFFSIRRIRCVLYALHDPHPEAGFKALFAKIWYEGASTPRHVWQSTGATDDFESKLSLVPVIIGSLKGTVYAMLFAVPVALLAAIYTSQFLHPDLRVLVKPTMEIMASLPSVILGFLAALWLAPLLETRVPSFLLIVTVIPLTALLFGWLWSSLPRTYRRWIKPGYDFWRSCLFCLASVMRRGTSGQGSSAGCLSSPILPLANRWRIFVCGGRP